MILAKEFNRSHFARESGESPGRKAYVPPGSLSLKPHGCPRLYRFHCGETTTYYRAVRGKFPAGALTSGVSRHPVCLRGGYQLRLPSILGVRGDARGRPDGEAGAGAGHGTRDTEPSSARGLGREQGEGREQPQRQERQCEDPNPQRSTVRPYPPLGAEDFLAAVVDADLGEGKLWIGSPPSSARNTTVILTF